LHITSDRIEKKVVIRAPVPHVWRAISDATEFGKWFGVALEGDFAVGRTVRGTWNEGLTEGRIREAEKKAGLTPGQVKLPSGPAVFCTVERIEPEHTFSFRWIPYGIDADVEPTTEPTTLVEFHLEKAADGTLLTIVESGFDRVPAHRRERAFRMNSGGWAAQAESLRNHVER
jgi:uncharacterized protein YndB with AHSA1/START domain